MTIEFIVNAVPKPGGSKSAFFIKSLNRSVIVDASKNKDWRKAVAFAAKEVFRGDPLNCPLEVEFHFTMPRPKSHFETRRPNVLRSFAPAFHATRPDATKLVRSTEDALTGILWKDDGQIVRQTVSKYYGTQPGVRVVVRPALS